METCLICSASYERAVWNQKYCSYECKEKARIRLQLCLHCGTGFETKKKTARYCSMMCSSLHQKKRIETVCINESCKKEFYIITSLVGKTSGYGKYCSKECQNKGMRQPYWFCCEHCGKLSEVFNITRMSKRKFCSDSCKKEHYRHEIDLEKLIEMYEVGSSVPFLADFFEVPQQYAYKLLKENNIEIRGSAFQNRFTCTDGHVVRSNLERIFDERLTHYGIEHQYEPRISKEARYFSDFKVGDVYIEIWGMVGQESYDKRKALKKAFYKKLGLKLLDVYPKDFLDIDTKIKELQQLSREEST